MANGQLDSVLHYLHGALPPSGTADLRDADLLHRSAEGNAVDLWEVATGRLRNRSPEPRIDTVSPDGRLLAGSEAGDLVLWDSTTGKEPVDSIRFFPEGGRLVSHAEDGTTVVWDLSAETVHH